MHVMTAMQTRGDAGDMQVKDANIGGVASAGFSVEGFTGLTLTYDSSADSAFTSREAIRIANTTSNTVLTAQVSDFPGNDITFDNDDNGDVWFGTYNNNTYRSPVAGNYAWATHIHELGHALGLSHGHDTWEIDNLPYAYDGNPALGDAIAKEATDRASVPVIGIAAGGGCDGQILVVDDMLGFFTAFKPKFVKRYADLGPLAETGIAEYAAEVRARSFPAAEHVFADQAPSKG